MARLSVLLSELDRVDKLAVGQINKLVTDISGWSTRNVAEGDRTYKTYRKMLGDWTWHSGYFNEYVLIKFLTVNKRFTKAMKALSSFHSASDDVRAEVSELKNLPSTIL